MRRSWRCRLEFREATLPNGLEIVAECNPRAYTTGLAFFVKTGSRDETAEIAGVSHFLEHMTFKGTPRRSAADVNRELDEIGSNSNAFTSEEQTVYYATVLPEYQGHALDLLADIMRPSLRLDDFETEKQVIIEEIHKYDDQPPFGAHEKCMAAFFQDHPLGNSILGTVESVDNLSAAAMKTHFQQRYSPGNMTLAAAGRVDFDALVEDAKKWCGDWPACETSRETAKVVGRKHFEALQKESATQEYVVQVACGPSADEVERYASRILCTILGDDTGSRFYWELIETGLAEYAGVGPYEFQGAGILMTYLCCDPANAEQNLERILQIQRQLETGGITDSELEIAKNKICSHVVRQSERPSNRLFGVGNGWIQRHSYQSVQERLAAYQKVNIADIERILQKYPMSTNTTVAVGPLNQFAAPS